jgi:hypothetical protein
MSNTLSWADIKKEFDDSVGYIRQDLRWLQSHNSGLNYTVLLLVGCGCEMLAAIGGDDRRRGEKVFAELLPAGDWRLLAARLYTALRDGLAHGFDTKHLNVDELTVQLYISWSQRTAIALHQMDTGYGVYIGAQPMVDALCGEVDSLETLLQQDEAARHRFKTAAEYQRTAPLNQNEAAAWGRLAAAARK